MVECVACMPLPRAVGNKHVGGGGGGGAGYTGWSMWVVQLGLMGLKK